MNVDALVHEALRWATVSCGGALALAAVATVFERTCGARRPGVASVLWWLVLVRLVTPPSFGSPIGVALPRRAVVALENGAGDVDVYGAFTANGVAIAALVVWSVGALVAAVCVARRIAAERRVWARVERREPNAATRAMSLRLARRLGLRRVPALAMVEGRGAALVGLVRPWIAVPAELESAERRAELEAVLAHELAHAARRDGWRRVVALAVCVPFWFHPAAWCAARRLAALAEFDCDRAAVRVVRGGAATCRAALLGQVRSWFAPHGGEVVASAFVRPPSLVLARFAALDRLQRGGARVRAELLQALLIACAAWACIGPASAVRDVVPPLAELDGCLQQRHAVMALYARALADGRVDEFLAPTSSNSTR